jgi:hypothetical protein
MAGETKQLTALMDFELPRAIVEALELWTDHRYEQFFPVIQLKPFKHEWFSWFQSQWKVARTINKQSREFVRAYLDTEFRRELSRRDTGQVVDEAAAHIQRMRWASRERKNGVASLPLSLVSKTGFLLTAGTIMPYDTFARSGLNALRGTKKSGGRGHLESPTYSEYIRAFDYEFEKFQAEIKSELASSWAKNLAARLGCSPETLQSRKFQRKIFDNVLMRIGGRQKAS